MPWYVKGNEDDYDGDDDDDNYNNIFLIQLSLGWFIMQL